MRATSSPWAPALLLIAAVTVMAATPSPTQVVKQTVDEILAILKDPALDWTTRQKRIEPIINERFDFRSMSQSVLATNWRKASPAERERFVEFFSQYLELYYLDKVKSYAGESVRYGKERIKGDRATVETFIVSGKTEIPVKYKLHLDDGQWFAYDVEIEGVSLVSNYRTVYSTIVKREGMKGLLDDLEDQIRQYEHAQETGVLR
jgi:phospholipid transport system substrate-binding protein